MKNKLLLSLLLVSTVCAAKTNPLQNYPGVVQSCDRMASAMSNQGSDIATAAYYVCLKGGEDGIKGDSANHAKQLAVYDRAFKDTSIPMSERIALPRMKMARNMGYSYGKKAVKK